MTTPIKDSVALSQAHRKVWVDLLKCLAIFMVICIHAADPFNVSAEARQNPDFNFWGSIYGSALRPCVPLFVMMTGVLLLPIQERYGTFCKKRLLRICIPFLVWSLLYNAFPWLTGVLGLSSEVIHKVFAYAPSDASQTWGSAWQNIVRIPLQFSSYTVHLWYIYMLIGLYLYLPLLSAWVESADRQEQRWVLSVWALSLFLPYVQALYSPEIWGVCAWNSVGTFYYLYGFSGYLLLAHYLSKELPLWSWRKTLAVSLPLWVAGFVVTYVGFRYITSQPDSSEQQVELFFQFCSPNVAMMTTAIFLIARKWRVRNERWQKGLSQMARCALGIYLMHYFVVGTCYACCEALGVPVALRIPTTALLAVVLCSALALFLYRLFPRLSKWVLG